MSQLRRHSILEVCLGTLLGFWVAFAANLIVLPWFGYSPTVTDNFAISCIYTFISLVRGYAVRRLFNWLHVKEIL